VPQKFWQGLSWRAVLYQVQIGQGHFFPAQGAVFAGQRSGYKGVGAVLCTIALLITGFLGLICCFFGSFIPLSALPERKRTGEAIFCA